MALRAHLFTLLVVCGVVLSWQAEPISGPATADLPGLVSIGDKAKADAVVWLEAPDAPKTPGTVVLDQRNLAFAPLVLVTSVGATVEFPNNDRVFHNVFSFKDGKVFDLGIYPVGKIRRVTFDEAGVSRLFCNIHPGMAAYIVVVDSPYHAVTGPDGSFVIRGVPMGRYTYHAWRPGGTTISDTVTIAAGTRLNVRWPAQ